LVIGYFMVPLILYSIPFIIDPMLILWTMKKGKVETDKEHLWRSYPMQKRESK
jgi:hypothetical protein